MKNDTITLTECDAITSFNNFKKFYNAFRKINNIKIEKTVILEFLYKLLNSKHNNRTYNEFSIFSYDFDIQLIEKCKRNESKIMKMYEKYFKEHIGHRFISFLKINDALDAYIYNLKEQLNETLLERILFASPDYYIDSFSWGETKQGLDYWDNLDEKWDCIITLERNAKKYNKEYYEQVKKIINKYEA